MQQTRFDGLSVLKLALTHDGNTLARCAYPKQAPFYAVFDTADFNQGRLWPIWQSSLYEPETAKGYKRALQDYKKACA